MTNKHFFETKEQYLAFRKAWANAVNSDKAKSKTVYSEFYDGTIREPGWITAAHHIFYNIVRNHPIDTGFTPVTRKTKLENGAIINGGLYEGWVALKAVVETAKEKTNSSFFNKPKISDYRERQLVAFLEPFARTINTEMLAQIELPKVERLDASFGKGKKLAQAILTSEKKPTTIQDLDELMKEAA